MTRIRSAVIRTVNRALTKRRSQIRGPFLMARDTPAAIPMNQWVRLSRTSPPAITRPTSHRGAVCGVPPAAITRRSNRRRSGSLTRRMKRDQAPKGLIRRVRPPHDVRATIEAYTRATMTRVRRAVSRVARFMEESSDSGLARGHHLHLTLGAGAGGAHEGVPSVDRRVFQNLAVPPAGEDLTASRLTKTDGDNRLPLHIHDPPNRRRREAFGAHLLQGPRRPSPVRTPVVDRSIEQFENFP